MAMSRKKMAEQGQLWIPAHTVTKTMGHPFYRMLNKLLDEVDFDSRIEMICHPYYADSIGRPSIAPGVYFRMLFVGYFEDIESQRGIAWRCADSLSLHAFLGLTISGKVPDHSSLTRIRQRLPMDVYDEVFAIVLSIANSKKLLKCDAFATDSTMLEANAAMKSIVRKNTGENWNAYVRRLMADEGIDNPTDDEVRRFDAKRKRKGKGKGKAKPKKTSNEEWESPTDPDSRVARMKDKRTHMAYRASHTMDLDTEIIVNASVDHANMGEAGSLPDQVEQADANLERAGCDKAVKRIVADKGYYSAATVSALVKRGVLTYIAKQIVRGGKRTMAGSTLAERKASWINERCQRSVRGRALQKKRSERIERSFSHVCWTGGGRRAWLRGLEPNRKSYKMRVSAHNLGRILRALFGIGKPRSLQGHFVAFLASIFGIMLWLLACMSHHRAERAHAAMIPANSCA